jgi:hypothetical protein
VLISTALEKSSETWLGPVRVLRARRLGMHRRDGCLERIGAEAPCAQRVLD